MLYLPLVLVLVIWFWPRIWFRAVQNRLTVSAGVSDPAVEPGGIVTIHVTVRNRSWLPCPNVTLSLELPPGLSAHPDNKSHVVTRTTFLMMRQEVTFDVRCYGWRRGLQELRHREVVLRVNEGFGLRELFLRREIAGSVVVYPSRVTSEQSIRAMRDLNGELERVRWLLPDEALLRGIRVYTPGDPFKHVAWHATARSGTWMTKQFSSSTDLSVGLVLNAQFVDPHWLGTKSRTFDDLCAMVAAVAKDCEAGRIPFYFASNGIYPGSVKVQWYGRQTYGAVRHVTGQLLPYTNGDFRALLMHCLNALPPDAPIVVFSAFLSKEQAKLLMLAAKQRQVYVVAPHSTPLPSLWGIPVMYFTSHEDEELESAAGTELVREHDSAASVKEVTADENR